MKPIYYGECPDCKKRMRLKTQGSFPKHACVPEALQRVQALLPEVPGSTVRDFVKCVGVVSIEAASDAEILKTANTF